MVVGELRNGRVHPHRLAHMRERELRDPLGEQFVSLPFPALLYARSIVHHEPRLDVRLPQRQGRDGGPVRHNASPGILHDGDAPVQHARGDWGTGEPYQDATKIATNRYQCPDTGISGYGYMDRINYSGGSCGTLWGPFPF